MTLLFQPLKSLVIRIGQEINRTFKIWTKPATPFLLLGSLSDLNRSKVELAVCRREPYFGRKGTTCSSKLRRFVYKW